MCIDPLQRVKYVGKEGDANTDNQSSSCLIEVGHFNWICLSLFDFSLQFPGLDQGCSLTPPTVAQRGNQSRTYLP